MLLEQIAAKTPIAKGWSGNQKYCAITADGRKYLSNTLSSLPWAVSFGEKEIQVMQKQASQVLQWYDGMHHVVPAWYQKN